MNNIIENKEIMLINNKYFKYVLKSSNYKIMSNKHYLLTMNSISENFDLEYINLEIKKNIFNRLKEQENFIKEYIKELENLKDINLINVLYTSMPVFQDDNIANNTLKMELVAFVELENKDLFKKFSYFFCNNIKCLEFIKSTISTLECAK